MYLVRKRRVTPERKISMDEIWNRVSVRRFEKRPVEKEKIEKVLRAAMQAPSAGDEEAWRFYVIEDKELLKKLARVSPYASPAAMAPAVLAVSYDRKALRFPEFGEIDCAIASENVLLELESLGLGGVMLGIAPIRERMDAVHSLLQLPEEEEAFTLIPFGYPLGKGSSRDRFDSQKVHYR